MSRLAILVSCVLLAGAATSAPLPLRFGGGIHEWDRPVDPDGDCGFAYSGEQLTITVPFGVHDLQDSLNAPRLLRNIEGDFIVQVRVGGDFRLANQEMNGVVQGAGLFLTDEERFVCLERVAGLCTPSLGLGVGDAIKHRGRKGMGFEDGPPLSKSAYLRLERRGALLTAATSLDGSTWTPLKNKVAGFGARRKLKIGLVAETGTGGNFKANFDQFKLINLGK